MHLAVSASGCDLHTQNKYCASIYHTIPTQLYEELSDIILGKHNTQLRFNSDTHYGIHTRQNYYRFP
jgi:hypothetical protein